MVLFCVRLVGQNGKAPSPGRVECSRPRLDQPTVARASSFRGWFTGELYEANKLLLFFWLALGLVRRKSSARVFKAEATIFLENSLMRIDHCAPAGYIIFIMFYIFIITIIARVSPG